MKLYFTSDRAGTATATERLKRQIELMEQYRTSLVAEVVTGQVDVREAVTAH